MRRGRAPAAKFVAEARSPAGRTRMEDKILSDPAPNSSSK